MLFKKVESREKPLEKEKNLNNYYIRKNIEYVEGKDKDDLGMYVYDEALCTADEFIVYLLTGVVDA